MPDIDCIPALSLEGTDIVITASYETDNLASDKEFIQKLVNGLRDAIKRTLDVNLVYRGTDWFLQPRAVSIRLQPTPAASE